MRYDKPSPNSQHMATPPTYLPPPYHYLKPPTLGFLPPANISTLPPTPWGAPEPYTLLFLFPLSPLFSLFFKFILIFSTPGGLLHRTHYLFPFFPFPPLFPSFLFHFYFSGPSTTDSSCYSWIKKIFFFWLKNGLGPTPLLVNLRRKES